jgi:hypothetical protein
MPGNDIKTRGCGITVRTALCRFFYNDKKGIKL